MIELLLNHYKFGFLIFFIYLCSMKRKETIRQSPYPYTISQIRDLPNGAKIVKAMVYDFLKKNRLLDFYYECYIRYHSRIEKSPEELMAEGIKPLDFYLNTASKVLIERGYHVRDFIYESDISFNWEDDIKSDVERMDMKWIQISDKLRC